MIAEKDTLYEPYDGTKDRDPAGSWMLTWSGDVVVHVLKSARWNLLFVYGDAFRSRCTFSLLYTLSH